MKKTLKGIDDFRAHKLDDSFASKISGGVGGEVETGAGEICSDLTSTGCMSYGRDWYNGTTKTYRYWRLDEIDKYCE